MGPTDVKPVEERLDASPGYQDPAAGSVNTSPENPGATWVMTEEKQAIVLTQHYTPDPVQIAKIMRIRAAAAGFIAEIIRVCPKSADRSAAVRHARDAMMTANAAVVVPHISL